MLCSERRRRELSSSSCSQKLCVPGCSTHTRDLGVIVSCDLSPAIHVAQVVSKDHRRAKLIMRTFTYRDAKLLVRAFVTYVRPILEYNTVIWSPCTASQKYWCYRSVCPAEIHQMSARLWSLFVQRAIVTPETKELGVYRRLIADLLWCYNLLTSCSVLAHVPTHAGMRTNCTNA